MNVGYENKDRDQPASATREWEGIKDDVSGVATEAVNAASARSREFLDSAREQAVGYVDRRKDSAAQSVEDVAHSLRETGSSLEDRPSIKAFVDSAADGLERLADDIRDRSFDDIYGDIEEFARRRPTVFAAAAGAVGFALARFLKSSSEARNRRASYGGQRERSGYQASRQQSEGATATSGSSAGSQSTGGTSGSHAGARSGSSAPGSSAAGMSSTSRSPAADI